MGQIMSLSLCVSDIDKDKITEGKNGKLYYQISIGTSDEKDKYGKDVSAWESQTKEEREGKADRKWLGNGEILWDSNTQAKPATKEAKEKKLPF